uniref:Uncharacterized protein n=1 Tax=Glossina austeni TaxID=7395 RepID=A0A1A9VDF9_GLOAU
MTIIGIHSAGIHNVGIRRSGIPRICNLASTLPASNWHSVHTHRTGTASVFTVSAPIASAFEESSIPLSTFTSSPLTELARPALIVPFGTHRVYVSRIFNPTIDIPLAGNALADPALADTFLAYAPLADTALADTALADTLLADVPLANTALADAPLANTALADTALAGTLPFGIPSSVHNVGIYSAIIVSISSPNIDNLDIKTLDIRTPNIGTHSVSTHRLGTHCVCIPKTGNFSIGLPNFGTPIVGTLPITQRRYFQHRHIQHQLSQHRHSQHHSQNRYSQYRHSQHPHSLTCIQVSVIFRIVTGNDEIFGKVYIAYYEPKLDSELSYRCFFRIRLPPIVMLSFRHVTLRYVTLFIRNLQYDD